MRNKGEDGKGGYLRLDARGRDPPENFPLLHAVQTCSEHDVVWKCLEGLTKEKDCKDRQKERKHQGEECVKQIKGRQCDKKRNGRCLDGDGKS